MTFKILTATLIALLPAVASARGSSSGGGSPPPPTSITVTAADPQAMDPLTFAPFNAARQLIASEVLAGHALEYRAGVNLAGGNIALCIEFRNFMFDEITAAIEAVSGPDVQAYQGYGCDSVVTHYTFDEASVGPVINTYSCWSADENVQLYAMVRKSLRSGHMETEFHLNRGTPSELSQTVVVEERRSNTRDNFSGQIGSEPLSISVDLTRVADGPSDSLTLFGEVQKGRSSYSVRCTALGSM